MNSEPTNDLAPVKAETLADTDGLPGIIPILGELKPGALVTEKGLALLFKRHPASIKRMIHRGELPRPCRMAGSNTWTAGAIVRHVEARMEEAAREAERMEQKLARLSP
jgi:hypothetical protein